MLVPRVLIVLMVPAATAFAQNDGVIAGRVVDGASGRPIAAAVVAISGTSLIGAAAQPPRILTGADGRFAFRTLEAGVYSVVATKGGYADGEPGRRRPGGTAPPIVISDVERERDVTVPMWKYAAIAGTVTDEAGEPVVKLEVRALLRANGLRTYAVARTTFTDDRGAYRFGNLAWGDYVIAACPAASGRPSATPPPVAGARTRIYPTTFYPRGAGVAQASSIAVAAGDDRAGIDMQLMPAEAARVSGLVLDEGSPLGKTILRMIPTDVGDVPADVVAPTSTSDGSGRFTFAGVVPGRYTLRVRAESGSRLIWAETPIAVTEDIDNLVVTMKAPLRVTAQTRYEGVTPPPSPPAGRFTQMPFMLDPVGGTFVDVVIAGTIDERGLSIHGFPPGRYRVHAPDPPQGWMLKAAMLNGVEVSETPFDLTKDVDDLTLVFTDRVTSLGGRLEDPFGAAPAILVFTADGGTWADAGAGSRRFRTMRGNARGEFLFRALPPGDYYVVAVPDEQTADWRDPAVLEALARVATRVTIGDGETKTIALRLAEMPR